MSLLNRFHLTPTVHNPGHNPAPARLRLPAEPWSERYRDAGAIVLRAALDLLLIGAAAYVLYWAVSSALG